MATFTVGTAIVIKKQVFLPSPTNMTEMTKALSFINEDLKERGIKYYDDTVRIESCDDSIVLWYDISDHMFVEDEERLVAAARASREVRTAKVNDAIDKRLAASKARSESAHRARQASLNAKAAAPVERAPESLKTGEPISPAPDKPLPVLTKEAAEEVAGKTGTFHFHLPSEATSNEIAVLRSRIRTAVRKFNNLALVETKVLRKPRSAFEVTIVH